MMSVQLFSTERREMNFRRRHAAPAEKTVRGAVAHAC